MFSSLIMITGMLNVFVFCNHQVVSDEEVSPKLTKGNTPEGEWTWGLWVQPMPIFHQATYGIFQGTKQEQHWGTVTLSEMHIWPGARMQMGPFNPPALPRQLNQGVAVLCCGRIYRHCDIHSWERDTTEGPLLINTLSATQGNTPPWIRFPC